MKKQLEQYFGCEVKVTECKNTLALPIFMTMRDIKLVEFCGVSFALINIIKEPELTIAAMKKQQKKYEEALQCPIAYEMALNSVSMRNALVKNGSFRSSSVAGLEIFLESLRRSWAMLLNAFKDRRRMPWSSSRYSL